MLTQLVVMRRDGQRAKRHSKQSDEQKMFQKGSKAISELAAHGERANGFIVAFGLGFTPFLSLAGWVSRCVALFHCRSPY